MDEINFVYDIWNYNFISEIVLNIFKTTKNASMTPCQTPLLTYLSYYSLDLSYRNILETIW